MSKKVGILGTGEVGQALGAGFLATGWEVKLGGREANNEKAKAWAQKSGPMASTGTFADAASFGDLVCLCTLWSGTENALKLANPSSFKGKVVIDVTNPLKLEANQLPQLAVGHTDSGGENVQRWLPGANVVKAFNTVGNALMYQPKLEGGPPDMFISGNDPGSKKTVGELCASFGWNTIDLGGIETARLTEPMCLVWVYYGIKTNTWNHAYKFLRKK